MRGLECWLRILCDLQFENTVTWILLSSSGPEQQHLYSWGTAISVGGKTSAGEDDRTEIKFGFHYSQWWKNGRCCSRDSSLWSHLHTAIHGTRMRMIERDGNSIGRLRRFHPHSIAMVMCACLRGGALHRHAMAGSCLHAIHIRRPLGRGCGKQQHQHRRNGEKPFHSQRRI
jgi:hypothetical protein